MSGSNVSIAAVKGQVNAKQVLASAAVLIETATAGRKRIKVQNLGPNKIYVGFSNAVTSATGWEVAATGGTLDLDLANGSQVWARAVTADQASPADTRVIELQ
jgi:hypothetical protein